jgi:hypothetical protein
VVGAAAGTLAAATLAGAGAVAAVGQLAGTLAALAVSASSGGTSPNARYVRAGVEYDHDNQPAAGFVRLDVAY